MKKPDLLPHSGAHRRLFLITGAASLLSACSNLIGPPAAAQMYALSPPPLPPQTGGKVGWALSIAKPYASDNLDSTRIALAKSNTELDYYANASWPDSLPALVGTAILAGFESSGRIASVSREEEALRADYVLATDIRDFEARYAVPDGIPSVAVVMVCHMADARSRRIVASLTVTETEAASANSVNAVVEAFDTALGRAVQKITQWALALPAPPVSAASGE
jgi:cholesterol transport system auxiliary component